MNTWRNRTGVVAALAFAILLATAGAAEAALIITSTEGGYNAFSAATDDVINLGSPLLAGQSNVGPSLYSSDPTGIGLNNGTIYAGAGYGLTEFGRTYCPANGSSITFDLASPQDIYAVVSVSGGQQARRSQRFRLEVSTVGDPSFSTVADENQIHFVSNAWDGEMRVSIADDLNAPIGTGVDQIRVTYFNTGAGYPESMYRELDAYNAPPPPPPPPPPPWLGITSANVTYHIDAGDMNNDGGATNPGDGNNITAWAELTTGAGLNIQGTPSWHASGLGGAATVRFDGGPPYGDLVYSNNPAIANTQAQTIYAVAAMTVDGFVLSDLVSNTSGTSTIRQTTSETADYYPGNSADFHFGGGSFTINGNPTFAIPGGFGALHVVKSVSPSAININSLRVGDNANNRLWSGDVAEILVFDGVLNGNDSARVNKYIIDKYGINQVIDEPLRNTTQIAYDPFGDGGWVVAAVNFVNTSPSSPGTSTLFGIAFDDVNGGTQGTTYDFNTQTGGEFYNLTANGTSATLETRFEFFHDRHDNGPAVTGTDAAVANLVIEDIHVISALNTIPGADQQEMTVGGLLPNQEVYLQFFGGDENWTGDLTFIVNGVDAGTWTTNTDNPSLFGFFAKTDAQGLLDIDMNVTAGNYSGVSGFIVFQRVPEPGTFLLLGLGGLALVPLARRRRR